MSDAPWPSRNYFSHSFTQLFGVGIISLRFDAPALRTLRVHGDDDSNDHDLHRGRTTPRQLTQSPFPEPSRGGSSAFRVALKG